MPGPFTCDLALDTVRLNEVGGGSHPLSVGTDVGRADRMDQLHDPFIGRLVIAHDLLARCKPLHDLLRFRLEFDGDAERFLRQAVMLSLDLPDLLQFRFRFVRDEKFCVIE